MSKICQNCKNSFIIEENDLYFYGRMKVPSPTFCPSCRFFRRSMWRNEHFLFKKKDDFTGSMIFSTYSPLSKVKIYEHSYWWSDKWDPMLYGKEFDFRHTFFEQFYNLLCNVPLCARSIENCIESDYSNHATNIKNAYLCFDINNSNDISYGFLSSGSQDCVDFYQTKDSRLCYETVSVVDSERMFWSSDCAHCYNVWFSSNCRNCTDCIGCVNLRNQKYCIFNKQYSKEDYEKEFHSLFDGSFSKLEDLIKIVEEFKAKFPRKYIHGKHNKNVTGDYIYASNNTLDCFEIHNVDNARFSQFIRHSKDIYDFTSWGISSELIYESVSCGENSQNLKFCFECWPSSNNLEYCVECHSSSDCFGCVGLKNAQHCIFNKQYSKEEYFTLKSKIIQHMDIMPYTSIDGITYKYGEFFPSELSPFTYEQSSASDYFPNDHYETIPTNYIVEVPFSNLPDNISNTDNSIIGKVIECRDKQICNHRCVGAFKITQMEFQLYKRFNIPLPRVCPNCRFYVRMEKLNPVISRDSFCMCIDTSHNHSGKCNKEFKTNYPFNQSIILYCEECYQQEVS